jgi:hypothetical protein
MPMTCPHEECEKYGDVCCLACLLKNACDERCLDYEGFCGDPDDAWDKEECCHDDAG